MGTGTYIVFLQKELIALLLAGKGGVGLTVVPITVAAG
jgi:hypothetical protein